MKRVPYKLGYGVPQDYVVAMKWYRKAADHDVEGSHRTALGLMYWWGECGVPQDLVTAHMWFNLAAAQDNPVARINLDAVAKEMSPAQIAEAQRLAREWKPR